MAITDNYISQLNSWEEKLRAQIGSGNLLLGELGYVEDDLKELGGLFSQAFAPFREKRNTLEQVTERTKNKWPLTFALYLTLEGVIHFDEEGYWHSPSTRLGLRSAGDTMHCGRLFLDILARFNLPVFNIGMGYTYVTPILLHGGIPTAHLEGFFDFLYKEELSRYQTALDARTLLAIWRQHPDEYLVRISKPVRRFLRYGRAAAEDFVERCLELLRNQGDYQDVDLPERVIAVFLEWQIEQGLQSIRQSLANRPRLARPILTLSPYTIGLALYLPPQQFPRISAPAQLEWLLQVGKATPQVIATEREPVESGYHYRIQDFIPVPPATNYTLSLQKKGEILTTWELPGFKDTPVLVIEPYDVHHGNVVNETEYYLSGKRWLLYSKEYRLDCLKGESYKVRDLPCPFSEFSLEEWELAVGELGLSAGNGRTSHAIIITSERSRKPPFFKGGEQPLPTTLDTNYPLYSGEPPFLIIPQANDVKRWRITIRAAGDSEPAGYRHYRLSELNQYLEVKEGDIWLNLAAPKLLGKQPVGRFELTIRGPLGWSQVLGLQILPHLSLDGHQTAYLNDAPATFSITCDDQTHIQPVSSSAKIRLEHFPLDTHKSRYTFTVPISLSDVSFLVRHEIGVTIPLTIPIQRLRWRIWAGNEDEQAEWQVRPSLLHPSGLSYQAEIRVVLPQTSEDRALPFGWQLVDEEGEILKRVSPDRTQSAQKILVSELTAVWRESQSPLCLQWIVLHEGQQQVIDAFYLQHTLELGEILCDWEKRDGQSYLLIMWGHPQYGVRRLHLWPLDRPWVQEPLIFDLPHSTATQFEIPLGNLPLEAYQGEIVNYNPWLGHRPTRPGLQQKHTFLVKPPGLADHYQEIVVARDQGQASPEQLLALLAHQYHNNQRNEMYQTNQAFTTIYKTIPSEWLVRWADTLKGLGDKNAYRLAQFKLFNGEMLAHLAEQDPPAELLERYFTHLPEDQLPQCAIWILKNDLRLRRQECLQILLNKPYEANREEYTEAIKALLQDVADASLLEDEAVQLLQLNAAQAAYHLAEIGSQEAAWLLRRLVNEFGLESVWIWRGSILESDIGRIIVKKLRHKGSNQRCFCTYLQAKCEADGQLENESSTLDIRLHFQSRRIEFLKNKAPYQCRYCGQVYWNNSSYQDHHDQVHADLPERSERLPKELHLSKLVITHPE